METFEILAQKSKKRNMKRMLLISLGSVMTVLGLLFLGHMYQSKRASDNLWKLVRYYEIREEIAYPNIESFGWETRSTGEYSGMYHSHRVKDLDGIVFPYNEVTGIVDVNDSRVDYNADLVTYMNGMWYTRGGFLKSPVFYNIKHKEQDQYAHPAQELPNVKKMTGQIVEVALTFDKLYSYDELEQMLPRNLKKNWYWLGATSTMNTAGFSSSNLYGMREPMSQFDTFRENLKKQIDSDFSRTIINDGEYDNKKDWMYFYSQYPSLTSSKFAGIILTGKSENFAQLEGKSWIYASSIGVATQNQPYYRLDKE